jgi:hypothetical protein
MNNSSTYENNDNEMINSPTYENNNENNNEMNNFESPSEGFANLSEYGINLDLILKSIFFGAIFYLLSLPEVYKLTSKVIGKNVDSVLVHSLVYAILYYILVHFI